MAQIGGFVKKLIPEKGFGFIRDKGGAEYFFHRQECLCDFDRLQQGDAVVFTPGEGPKGPRAERVGRP